MSTEDQRRLVESFVVRGLYPVEEMEAAAERLGAKGLLRLTTATMTEAVSRRYGETPPTPDHLRIYGRHFNASYGERENPAKASVVEVLIRAHFGEPELMKPLPVDDIITHQILIAYDIFTSLNLDEPALDRFVANTLALAADNPPARPTPL